MPMTLSEYEAICKGESPGEITPADVSKIMGRVSVLADTYARRLFDKAEEWKPKRHHYQHRQSAPLPPTRTKRGGIENSLPRGDV